MQNEEQNWKETQQIWAHMPDFASQFYVDTIYALLQMLSYIWIFDVHEEQDWKLQQFSAHMT